MRGTHIANRKVEQKMAKGQKLVIVESPTKARKIGGYLGDDYTVLASVGHIRDLAQPSQIPASDKAEYGKFGVNVDDGFKQHYDLPSTAAAQNFISKYAI